MKPSSSMTAVTEWWNLRTIGEQMTFAILASHTCAAIGVHAGGGTVIVRTPLALTVRPQKWHDWVFRGCRGACVTGLFTHRRHFKRFVFDKAVTLTILGLPIALLSAVCTCHFDFSCFGVRTGY